MKRNAGMLMFGLCVALVLSSCGRRNSELVNVASNDDEMNAAKQKARDSFQRFKDHWNADKKAEFTMVKVYFRNSEVKENGEHMWVAPTDLESVPMRGVLEDNPEWVKTVKNGDAVSFNLSDVSDWIYVENHKAVGAFTQKLLRQRMTAAQRKEHDAGYPFAFE